MTNDEQYIRRCIELAQCGEGLTYPNPMVGAVVVCDGKIIGEGYHIKAGCAHAEVNAINSVKDKSLLQKSTIYVSLEPCAHYGKTPPCAKLIIDSKIPNVVVGCTDTFSQVSGKGIQMLRDAGINVTTNILEKECRELNKRFFTYHEKKRPYIILKWAETADGFIDKRRQASEPSLKITGPQCNRMVHKQRATEQAILVGTNTAIMDNPNLILKYWQGNDPYRIVTDRCLRIPATHNLFNDKTPTYILNGQKDDIQSNTAYVKLDHTSPQTICDTAYRLNIQSIIVEGGQQILQSFIDANLWDEAYVYRNNAVIGEGVKGPDYSFDNCIQQYSNDDNTLTVWRNLD